MSRRLFLTLVALGGGLMSAEAEWELAFAHPPQPLPGGAAFVECEARKAGLAVRIHRVQFLLKQCRLTVLDNEPQRESLESALAAANCFAGVNGGYFHDSFTPVGLLISQGRTLHGFERAKLLSGVLVIRGKQAALVRASEFQASPAITDAVQAGPFLLDRGVPTPGLHSEKMARRTVIACDAEGRWALLLFSHVSLAEAAQVLASPAIFPEVRWVRALNLDGGSSSALWAGLSPKPFYLRGFTTVRNFIGVRELSR